MALTTTGHRLAVKLEADARPKATAKATGLTMVPMSTFSLVFRGGVETFQRGHRYVVHADLKAAITASGADVVME